MSTNWSVAWECPSCSQLIKLPDGADDDITEKDGQVFHNSCLNDYTI